MSRDVLKRIEEAGVVGAGGGGFPTHIKAARRADTVIANYAECEPLVASDSAVVSTDVERVLEGLALMKGLTGATKAVIAVKTKRKKEIGILEGLAGKRGDFSLHLLEDVYPAGDEHVLVEEVTGRVVPQGGIPPQVSVIVSNVTTLWRVALANEGTPFTERYVTVAGEVRAPASILVPVGTPIGRLIEACGGATVESPVVILGGPMMGEITEDTEAPVRKTTSAVIVLPQENALVRKRRVRLSTAVRRAMAACMQCSDCTLLCPRRLLGHQLFPHRTMRSVAFWMKEPGDEIASASLCSECGLCGIFVCPMELSPVQIYQSIKKELVERGVRLKPGGEPSAPLAERAGRRVPVERLVMRLGLSAYDGETMVGKRLTGVKTVRIPIREKWGRMRATVLRGDVVKEGAVVAEPIADTLGARAHASIGGTVTSVTEDFVSISA